MSTYVVDANVIVKWFVQESHDAAAERLLNKPHDFIGPDFLNTEVLNTFLKKLRQQDMTEQQIRDAMSELSGRFVLKPSEPWIRAAAELGIRYRRSAFDAIYLLIARDNACQWVTADGAAYGALSSDFSAHLLWIEDVPA